MRIADVYALSPIASPTASSTQWQASLSLKFSERRGHTTVHRSHSGPLLIQRPLYPEGPGVCQTILVHPPGGVVGGDRLDIRIEATPGSHSQITSPGASRWYRSLGPEASQRVTIDADGAIVEWLPLETIVFDRARATTQMEVDLRDGGRFLGWEILCLGRTASGERFQQGQLHRRTVIRQDGRLLWNENSVLKGGDPLLTSPVGLHGRTVLGTLLLAGGPLSPETLEICRRKRPLDATARAGASGLPNLLVAHYLGNSSEDARRWLKGLWEIVRPVELGRQAVPPRIWNT